MNKPNIIIPVDLTNPGQFFACCGLMELADRLWDGVEGWFGERCFNLLAEDTNATLIELLEELRGLTFDVGNDTTSDSDVEDETEDEAAGVDPIELRWRDETPAFQLDWWSDKSIKPWAGSMKERVILRAMLDAVDPQNKDPFKDLRRVHYLSKKLTRTGMASKPKKKEPFYFDPRRGSHSHPLDSGFSPDAQKMEADCCCTLEAACFIGLQRARPAPTENANVSTYTVWRFPMPVNVVAAVICGQVQNLHTASYTFENFFRTDQRKHKSFSYSTPDGESS